MGYGSERLTQTSISHGILLSLTVEFGLAPESLHFRSAREVRLRFVPAPIDFLMAVTLLHTFKAGGEPRRKRLPNRPPRKPSTGPEQIACNGRWEAIAWPQVPKPYCADLKLPNLNFIYPTRWQFFLETMKQWALFYKQRPCSQH